MPTPRMGLEVWTDWAVCQL